jgi:hypothetical protein
VLLAAILTMGLICRWHSKRQPSTSSSAEGSHDQVGHGSATSNVKAGSQDQVSVLLHANPLYGGSTSDNNAAVYASVADDGNGGTEATRSAASGQDSGIAAGSYAVLDKTTVTARYHDSVETDGAFR